MTERGPSKKLALKNNLFDRFYSGLSHVTCDNDGTYLCNSITTQARIVRHV